MLLLLLFVCFCFLFVRFLRHHDVILFTSLSPLFALEEQRGLDRDINENF